MRRLWLLALAGVVAGCASVGSKLDDEINGKRDPIPLEVSAGPPIEAALGGVTAAIGLTNSHKATGDLALYHTSPAALTSGRRYPLRIDVNRGLILGEGTATIGTVSLAAGGGVVDTELPAAAALADNAANPTTPMVGANLSAWDGATWDRVTNGSGVLASALRVTIATDDPVNDALSVVGSGTATAATLRITQSTDDVVSVDDNAGSLTIDNAQLSVVGGGAEATAMRVTLANDSTGLVSVDDNAGSLTIDNAQLSVVGAGAEATAMRVTLANDSTGLVSVDDNGGALTTDWAGVAPPIGAGLEATALRVTLATDSTGLVSVDDNAGSLTVDNAQLSVVGGGAEATAMRVTIANDSTGVLSVDDNAGSITVDNAQLSIVGAGAEATAMRVTLANDSTGLVSVDDNGAALTVDWAGTAPPIGAGLEGTALRVTLATDSTGLVSVDDNAGSLTVDNAQLSVVGAGAEATAMRVTIANDSTGLLSIDDNSGSLTTDSLTDVAPDAAFPATARAIAGRASTAKPTAMSGDADAVGIWTSRVGSIRTLSGEVALVTSSTLGADLAIVGANTGNRLVLVTVRERSGAAATLVVRHGTLDSDIQIVPVSLAANGVAVYQFPGGVNCQSGVFLDWLSGSMEVTIGTEDHE